MLIDLGRLNSLEINVKSGTAIAGSGVTSEALVDALAEHDLFFPAGHCPTVAIGGFLLQGGWGWNSRALGVGCMNVRAVDVVTPDGRLIHANATENPEYLWGARGAGSGFYGIVTRYYLSCHERPKSILRRQDIYPADCGAEVFEWAFGLQSQLPKEVEWFVFCSRASAGERAQYRVEAISFLPDEQTGRAALAIFDSCPVRDQAIEGQPVEMTTMPDLFAGSDDLYVEGYRWAADNAWFDDCTGDLAAALVEAANVLPPWPSHLVVYGWPSPLPVPDAAFSMFGDLYACAVGGWADPTMDDVERLSPMRAITLLEPFAKGMGLADEGLAYRDAPVHSLDSGSRLEAIRREADPQTRFLSYLTTRERLAEAATSK